MKDNKPFLRKKHWVALTGMTISGVLALVVLLVSFHISLLAFGLAVANSVLTLFFWFCVFNLEVHPDVWTDDDEDEN